MRSDIGQQPGSVVSDRAHLIAFCTRYYTERHLPENPQRSQRRLLARAD